MTDYNFLFFLHWISHFLKILSNFPSSVKGLNKGKALLTEVSRGKSNFLKFCLEAHFKFSLEVSSRNMVGGGRDAMKKKRELNFLKLRRQIPEGLETSGRTLVYIKMKP